MRAPRRRNPPLLLRRFFIPFALFFLPCSAIAVYDADMFIVLIWRLAANALSGRKAPCVFFRECRCGCLGHRYPADQATSYLYRESWASRLFFLVFRLCSGRGRMTGTPKGCQHCENGRMVVESA